MVVNFTEDELRWIERKPKNWHVKKGAPERIRKSVEKKLKAIYEHESRLIEAMKGHRNGSTRS